MAMARKRAGIKTFLKTLLAGVVLPWGCADLSLEADRIPTELVIASATDLLTVGESTRLALAVYDQNGELMAVPGWAPPIWKVSDPQVAEVGKHETQTGLLVTGWRMTGLRAGMVDVTVRVGNLETVAHFRVNPGPIASERPGGAI